MKKSRNVFVKKNFEKRYFLLYFSFGNFLSERWCCFSRIPYSHIYRTSVWKGAARKKIVCTIFLFLWLLLLTWNCYVHLIIMEKCTTPHYTLHTKCFWIERTKRGGRKTKEMGELRIQNSHSMRFSFCDCYENKYTRKVLQSKTKKCYIKRER